MIYIKAYLLALFRLSIALGILFGISCLFLGIPFSVISMIPFAYLSFVASLAGPIGVWIDKE